VPASRSRTERWRECLRQVFERDGAIEISVPTSKAGPGLQTDSGFHGADLIWRVRIVSLSDTEIVVEQPTAAGRPIELEAGIRLIAVLAIGQNRWMFHTRITSVAPGRPVRTLRLVMPQTVERCQRRNFFRISTAELSLPAVDCWPLLDPTTVAAAEVANRAQIQDLIDVPAHQLPSPEDEPLVLPEVGPRFNARLMNIGGGGAGLIIDHTDAAAADRPRLYWLRVNLMPQIPAPIGITARMVHTHIDSAQNLYAGMAFEWSFHVSHRDFVIEQICRYVAILQKQQAA
jgi:hypothetical protein